MYFALILYIFACWGTCIPVEQSLENDLELKSPIYAASVLNLVHKKKKFREFYGDYDYDENECSENVFDDVDGTDLTSHFRLQLLDTQFGPNNGTLLMKVPENKLKSIIPLKATLGYILDRKRIQDKTLVKGMRKFANGTLNSVKQMAFSKKDDMISKSWDKFFKIFAPLTNNWSDSIDQQATVTSKNGKSNEYSQIFKGKAPISKELLLISTENSTFRPKKTRTTHSETFTTQSSPLETITSSFTTIFTTVSFPNTSSNQHNSSFLAISCNKASKNPPFFVTLLLSYLLTH